MAVVIGFAVGASLATDLMWYAFGRWRGTWVLKMLGRLAPNAGMLVRRAQSSSLTSGHFSSVPGSCLS
jgi:membrane protein DedA with SNARE-associated domain